MALVAARNGGDPTAYNRLLAEATMEPARSLVLIDTFVRLLLNLVHERANKSRPSREELLRVLALVMARKAEEL
ncbi:MAG TPA: hypothetical protein VHF27_12190 [Acidimicrobiales bacterium]|nr:hypothetical protein [Acidimicrobiales bacterium]